MKSPYYARDAKVVPKATKLSTESASIGILCLKREALPLGICGNISVRYFGNFCIPHGSICDMDFTSFRVAIPLMIFS